MYEVHVKLMRSVILMVLQWNADLTVDFLYPVCEYKDNGPNQTRVE